MAKRPAATALDATVRANLHGLIRKFYDGKPGRMQRLNKGVNLRGLQDFLDGESTVYLSTVHPWATAFNAFGVKPFHLFIPNLNVDDLPEAISGKRLRKLEKIRKDILDEEG